MPEERRREERRREERRREERRREERRREERRREERLRSDFCLVAAIEAGDDLTIDDRSLTIEARRSKLDDRSSAIEDRRATSERATIERANEPLTCVEPGHERAKSSPPGENSHSITPLVLATNVIALAGGCAGRGVCGSLVVL